MCNPIPMLQALHGDRKRSLLGSSSKLSPKEAACSQLDQFGRQRLGSKPAPRGPLYSSGVSQ